jgi:hypothetical protein
VSVPASLRAVLAPLALQPDGGSSARAADRVAPPVGPRLLVAFVIAAACGAFAYVYALTHPDKLVDIDQVWFAARALVAGRNPYDEVGPGRAFSMDFRLYYPLPAVMAFAPLTLLPMHVARASFIAVSMGTLAFAVTRDGWWRLSIFVSGSVAMTLIAGQWSPLLTAALYFPVLGALFVVKPNVGLALATAFRTDAAVRTALFGGLSLLAASLLVQPGWPRDWLAAVRSAPHFVPPVLHWGGPFILLALLRWRRPEARMLVAFACIPHTTLVYEALPLLLVASNLRESLLLGLLSAVVYLVPVAVPELATPATARIAITGELLVALLYLPCVLLVLRRPNQGLLPGMVERQIGRLDHLRRTFRARWAARLGRA